MPVPSRSTVVSGGVAKACIYLTVWLPLAFMVGCDDDGGSEQPRPDAVVDADDADDIGLDSLDQSGADADDSADVGDGQAEPDAGTSRLSNGEFTSESALLAPLAGEEGALVAARLTPPGYPFAVEQLVYGLGHGPAGEFVCNATYEHHVTVFASTSTSPPATPSFLADVTMPEVDDNPLYSEGRYITVDLETPVTLTEGEELYVAVTLMGSYPDVMCIQVDIASDYEGSRNYWTNDTEAPHEWAQLDSFGLEGSIVVVAYGRVVE